MKNLGEFSKDHHLHGEDGLAGLQLAEETFPRAIDQGGERGGLGSQDLPTGSKTARVLTLMLASAPRSEVPGPILALFITTNLAVGYALAAPRAKTLCQRCSRP